MSLDKLAKGVNIMMTFVEERKGTIQKLIKFISEILIKLSRWFQPRRR